MNILASAVMALLLSGCLLRTPCEPIPGQWLTGDLHNHTYLTDGRHPPTEVFSQAFHFGLDWLANSEHGGAYRQNPQGEKWPPETLLLGNPPSGKMWRWQSLWHYSYPIITKARTTYPKKNIILGYEWNVPAHDHASVGIIGPAEEGGKAIARHEYLFDAADSGTSANNFLEVTNKSTDNTHARAIAGIKWLNDYYPENSYVIINHPSRRLLYSIADLRDFNDTAPRIAFGFEGIPGHQKAASRGNYNGGPFKDATGQDLTGYARTYGGADYMISRVGGLWDALLGEGRRFFTFANSDFHDTIGGFWPGEYAKNHTFVRDMDHNGKYSLSELLESLRSGNSFIVTGDLINNLDFSLHCGGKRASMGETLESITGNVEVRIRFRSQAKNNNGDPVAVDHIDLIMGEVTGRVEKYLADGSTLNPAYNNASNETTRVLATFTSKDWQKNTNADGWKSIIYQAENLPPGSYFRLRGSSLGCGMPKETDAQCNPLQDDLLKPNTAAKAYADLWFYSNPIFVKVIR